MDENKEKTQQTTEEQKPAQAESNTIDFSKFSLWSEPSQPVAEWGLFRQPDSWEQNTNPTWEPNTNTEWNQNTNPTWESNINTEWNQNQSQEQAETKNLIAELNSMQQDTTPDVHVEDIRIQESTQESKEAPTLWESWIGKDAITQRTNKKIEQIMLAYIAILISFLAIFLISIYNKYISLSVNPTENTNQTFVERVKTITKTISEHTNVNEYALRADKTDIMTNPDAKNTTKNIIQSRKLNYLHKKDILEKNTKSLTETTLQNAQKLDSIKKEIIKYGFIPQQLYDIIETKQWTNGIKKRISLIENIKFITAFKAFSYMESFIKWFANSSNKDPILIEWQLKKMMVDAEKDIVVYTNTCFLNPYEITNNCSTIEDFDNYYKIIETQREVDTDFIKQLANYVENKLQETDVPTFSINFLKFNPKEDKVEFTIDLNTNSQDEISLNKQWILNPHVFIVTNLINLLKQSLLVIWEWIKADQIKTSPKIIRVGSTVFTVNNSSIKLSLPIQKGSQREISDFFSSKY